MQRHIGETLIDELTKTPKQRRLYEQERVVLEVTELACELMKKQKMTPAGLGSRMGYTVGLCVSVLNGSSRISLESWSELFGILGHRLHFSVEPLENEK